MTQIDPRIIQMREVLLQTVSEKYQALAETINKIPLINDFKVEALRKINGGFLWAKEGISILTFNFEAEEKKEIEPASDPVLENNPGIEL